MTAWAILRCRSVMRELELLLDDVTLDEVLVELTLDVVTLDLVLVLELVVEVVVDCLIAFVLTREVILMLLLISFRRRTQPHHTHTVRPKHTAIR